MITENNPTVYSIRVNGVVLFANLASRTLAEATLFQLSLEQRALAEIVPTTVQGQQILFG